MRVCWGSRDVFAVVEVAKCRELNKLAMDTMPPSIGNSVIAGSAKRTLEIRTGIPAQRKCNDACEVRAAERWVGSCRRDVLDHVIPVNERHLKRLLAGYVCYFHEDRTHLGLNKETPNGRVRPLDHGRVISHARLGGLHHRYDRAA